MKKSLYRLDQLNREELHKVNQLGCGYCLHENKCPMRNPKVNKAKLGCKDYKHFEDSESERPR